MATFAGSIGKYPARVSLFWYALLVAGGTVLLRLPFSSAADRPPLTTLDALFTATSAVCVTGLTVRSTAHDLSFWGQLVVLALIQIGGIGIMTVTTFVTIQFGQRAGLRHRILIAETLGADHKVDLLLVLRRVLQVTVCCELTGFLVLAGRNLLEMPVGPALWEAAFHAISAFCNAGFALFDDSLTRYQGDFLVNGTICTLIIVGGIGFPVIIDLLHRLRESRVGLWGRLGLHSRLMILGTVALIAFGFTALAVLEWDGVLSEMPWHRKFLVCLFGSVTCRTAGFNTVDLNQLTNASLFVIVLLMIVGAGPCSTGGGLKVTTFLLIVLRGVATALGFEKLNLMRRTISQSVLDRSMASALIFGSVAVTALTVLLMLGQSRAPHTESLGLFMAALFEVTSALGTVGLSVGATGDLSEASRLIIIALMFIGRLGPFSVAAGLSRTTRRQPIEYPESEPLIG